jgi:hypothetical protein
MTDTYDDFDFDDGECPECGGEGRVAGTCIDGCCVEQDDPDCPYCSHSCETCAAAIRAASNTEKESDDGR